MCNSNDMKIIATTVYKKGFNLIWYTDFVEGYQPKLNKTINDIQVVLETDSKKYLADAICNYVSYGVEQNLWEVMCEHPPKSWGDSVKGYLTWQEVEKLFDREIKLLK